MMEWVSLGIIILTSAVIFVTGNIFASRSSRLGTYLGMSPSVKGATLDAISSSLPEFLVALFGVLFFNTFEVGMGTIAGSALFNILIIPGICVLVAPVAFKVNKEVIERDALFYIIAVFALLAALSYSRTWGLVIPLILLGLYVWYIIDLKNDTKAYKKTSTSKKSKDYKPARDLIIAIFSLAGLGIATYFLTQHAISFSESIGVHPLIISFTIVAAATSLPDAVVSISNARKGSLDDAISNVFGSNIFNIFGGLSIPVLLWYLIHGPLKIAFDRLELIFFLLGASIIVFYMLVRTKTISKAKAVIMILLFTAFVAYTIHLATIIPV
ncbi:MAG: sodium:calcium antiporter [Candidatus Woesearchaeota archaeon]